MNDASSFNTSGPNNDSASLLSEIQHHIMTYMGNDFNPPRIDTYYQGLALSVRDRLIENWLSTQRSFYDQNAKRVYYLSMEFLPGRFLMNNILNLEMAASCRQTLEKVGLSLEEIEEAEWDPGLGNGGLGRLASCYMDSMAALKIPGYGYGLRYEYGIFHQTFVDGYQVERCDNWVRHGNPWEIKRRAFLSEVKFYGRSEPYTDEKGILRYRWRDAETVMAIAHDILIPGYGNNYVNNMRLWAASSSREFNLQEFNQGDYMGAVESKVISENISKVLYPMDETITGKELRMKQQYFLVAATFQDILRRFKKKNRPFDQLPDQVAVQLNDTHPCIAIPEFMRLLMDEEWMQWEAAWDICTRTFAYTNHTVLPEALEVWPADLLGRVLPRHLEIIYEINRRFMAQVRAAYPDDLQKPDRMAIVVDTPQPRVRMAHLAVVSSHSVNGVSALHTKILKDCLFKDFDEFFPGRIKNITNGITPRRWLLQANPALSELISEAIGPEWINRLDRLKQLALLADDAVFTARWQQVKMENKKALATYIQRKTGERVDPETLFDVHAKRIHEYKRQVLNVLHVITLYNRIKSNPAAPHTPRTVIFAGKAAPGYVQAKLIIKLINAVADFMRRDPDVNRWIKVVFLPNYCVSQAEKIIPATDLSQQISTAGYEASGTGNMKFALNGALTIGTLDGANIEILTEVGEKNIFIFGLTAQEVETLKRCGYAPRHYYETDPELKAAVDMIRSGAFSPDDCGLFSPIVRELMDYEDRYLVMADYRSYIDAQKETGRVYRDAAEWTRRSIRNTAHMGKFSSDRAVMEYAEKIWGIKPLGA